MVINDITYPKQPALRFLFTEDGEMILPSCGLHLISYKPSGLLTQLMHFWEILVVFQQQIR